MPPTSAPEVPDVTLGEVNRNLNRIGKQVEELARSVVDAPKWSEVRRIESALRTEREQSETRLQAHIDALQAWQTWAVRSILGAVILAAMGALYAFGR